MTTHDHKGSEEALRISERYWF